MPVLAIDNADVLETGVVGAVMSSFRVQAPGLPPVLVELNDRDVSAPRMTAYGVTPGGDPALHVRIDGWSLAFSTPFSATFPIPGGDGEPAASITLTARADTPGRWTAASIAYAITAVPKSALAAKPKRAA